MEFGLRLDRSTSRLLDCTCLTEASACFCVRHEAASTCVVYHNLRCPLTSAYRSAHSVRSSAPSLHGHRDTRAAAARWGRPWEPARQPPMGSQDRLSVRNNFHSKKSFAHTRNFLARCRLQELRKSRSTLDTSIRRTTRPLRSITSSFWPSCANPMSIAVTKKIGTSPMLSRPT